MTRDLPVLFCRFLVVIGMMVWVGGFTFYGGAVVPILDDALGSFDAGMLTRRVTNQLNAVGLVVVVGSFLLFGLERRLGPRWARWCRLALLAATALALLALFSLHAIMDNHLDQHGTSGFRPWHRRYLMVSTGQWLINLALIAVYLFIWTWGDARGARPAGDPWSTPRRSG